ncbi:MAG: methylated-DNA--[protein]-cysteine S-methyltransferase [Bacillota bacterium]
MKFAYYTVCFGILKIGYCDETVFSLSKVETIDTDNEKTIFSDCVYKEVTNYLSGDSKELSFPYELRGTPFQKMVWSALCTIPYGETRSYKDIAIQIGKPNAARAVGMANNRNPILLKVPCHRVIGADGGLVGYGAGLPLKQYLLNMESNKN